MEEGRSATNAAKSDILLATVMRVAELDTEAVMGAKVDTEAAMAVEPTDKVRRAILAEDMATCLGIAPRVKSAITVRPSHFPATFSRGQSGNLLTSTGGEVGHLSRDCPSEPSSERVCYKCKQPGHVQAVCAN